MFNILDYSEFEYVVIKVTEYIVLLSQMFANIIIFTGIVKTMFVYAKSYIKKYDTIETLRKDRMELGYSLSLALGVLIGASILKSAIAPTWQEIGQLASIIAIRSTLNFFLTRESK